jgi:hypothetical protein
VAVKGGQLYLGSGAILDLRVAINWEAQAVPLPILPLKKRFAYMHAVAIQVLNHRPGNGLSGLLVDMLEIPTEEIPAEIKGSPLTGELCTARTLGGEAWSIVPIPVWGLTYAIR